MIKQAALDAKIQIDEEEKYEQHFPKIIQEKGLAYVLMLIISIMLALVGIKFLIIFLLTYSFKVLLHGVVMLSLAFLVYFFLKN